VKSKFFSAFLADFIGPVGQFLRAIGYWVHSIGPVRRSGWTIQTGLGADRNPTFTHYNSKEMRLVRKL